MTQKEKDVREAEKRPLPSRSRRWPVGKSAPPALRIVLRTSGCLLCLLAVAKLSTFLEQSREFALQRIRVEGCQRTDVRSIRRLCGIRPGMNLLSLDAGKISKRLENVPSVRSATVLKEFPHDLLIKIRERSPALLVKVEGELCYMDGQGVVFSKVHPGDVLDLPVVTGLDDYRWSVKPRQEGRVIQVCLALLRELNRSEVLGTLSEIHVDPSRGMQFFLEGFPVPVRIGWQAFHERRVRLERVLPFLLEEGPDIASVDLRFARRVLVKRTEQRRGRMSSLRHSEQGGKKREKGEKEGRHGEGTRDA